MPTSTKLTTAQKRSWEVIRHAFPETVRWMDDHLGCTSWRSGFIHTGGHKKETLTCLEAAGYIRVDAYGDAGRGDRVVPVADVGKRTVTIYRTYATRSCVKLITCITVTSTTEKWNTYPLHTLDWDAQSKAADHFRAAGWEVTVVDNPGTWAEANPSMVWNRPEEVPACPDASVGIFRASREWLAKRGVK